MNTDKHGFGNVGASLADARERGTGGRGSGFLSVFIRVHPWLTVWLLILGGSFAPAVRGSTLDDAWREPPAAARPWVFWYWMKGAYSAAGITADLEAMADAGIAGAYLMPINDVPDAPLMENSVRTLTPPWWALLRHAFAEAERLGLKLAMHACDGFATAGGPWITPELSMQKVVWSETRVTGGREVSMWLEQPETREGFYRDLGVWAIPVGADDGITTNNVVPLVTTSWPDTDGQFLVGPTGEKQIRTAEAGWIQYAFTQPFTARSLVIKNWTPNYAGLYHATRLAIEVSDDGETFRPHFQLTPPRHGWQDWEADYTFALPEVTARFFRFRFDPEGGEAGSEDLNGAKWRARLLLRGLELSATARLDNYEAKSGVVWRRAEAGHVAPGGVAPSTMVELTSRLQADGKLTWQVPPGRWLILRIGHTSTGHRNETAGAGKGLEVDKFNPTAVNVQFNGWMGRTIEELGPALVKDVLAIFHVDSWEAGSQNWSPVMRDEFTRRRGYDPLPWLPAMTGIVVENAAASERFLADLRLTISDLTQDSFFTVMAQRAHANGLKFSAEATAPTMLGDGMRHFAEVDIPMGEFWLRSETHDKPNDMHDAISGAHVYGRNIVQAEAFTELRARWDEHPGMLKPLADANLALGINRFVFHVFTHNPWLDRKPGMTLNGVGLVFQRDQTWWADVRAWTDYIARCSALLQLGRPVADVAYFTGEDLPTRALLPERYRPSLPAGYSADSINRDALLRLASVKDRRLMLVGGASYAVLVVPDRDKISAALRVKLDAWEAAGLSILGPDDDLVSALRIRGVKPAVQAMPTDWVWTRRDVDGAPLYFVANQASETRAAPVNFAGAKQWAVWDPVSGERRAYDGALELPAHGSAFLVPVAEAMPAREWARTPLAAEWTVTWRDPINGEAIPSAANLPHDWSLDSDPRVSGFSGTATYRATVQVDAVGEGARLDLGDVANLARVIVNGVDCGVAWTPPYRVDVSAALKTGANEIEVQVTNTWANRLLTEQALPEQVRSLWTTVPPANLGKALLPAGLMGPVNLEILR